MHWLMAMRLKKFLNRAWCFCDRLLWPSRLEMEYEPCYAMWSFLPFLRSRGEKEEGHADPPPSPARAKC